MRIWKDCPACREVGIPGKVWKIYPPFLCDFKTKPCPTCRAHFKALDEVIAKCIGVTAGIASRADLKRILDGMSPRRKQAYEAGFYNGQGILKTAMKESLGRKQ